MVAFWVIVSLVHKFALALAVGGATFALIFPIRAKMDGNVDTSERDFMGNVFFVFRGALVVVVLMQLILISSFIPDRVALLLKDPVFLVNWLFFLVIGVSVAVIRYKLPLAKLAPTVLAGTVYSLFILHALPGQLMFTLSDFLILYVAFVAGLTLVYTAIKGRYSAQPATPPQPVA